MNKFILIPIVIICFLYPTNTNANKYVAYSLVGARNFFNKPFRPRNNLTKLGGITHLLGLVFDRHKKDWILVGKSIIGYPPITIDDFVVVLRAVFLHQKFPLVSIDNTAETLSTGKQTIRFEGGIENTQIGKDMIDADILLKRIALENIKANIWGVRSYVSLRSDQRNHFSNGDQVCSRFWFKNTRPSIAVREDVYTLMDLSLGINTEVLFLAKDGKRIRNNEKIRDEAGENFTRQLMLNIDDLTNAFPILKRTLPILALVSLADALNKEQVKLDLKYWLYDFNVNKIETPTEFDLITVKKILKDKQLINTFSGGLELNPITVRLKRGYPTAFKHVVLNSRPSSNTIIWHPPLQGWQTPGLGDIETNEVTTHDTNQFKKGFSIFSSIMNRMPLGSVQGQKHAIGKVPTFQTSRPLQSSLPIQSIYSKIPDQKHSGIGGVMLSDVASVLGARPAKVDLSGGNFAFIVDGKNAKLSPKIFRKFITALWTVYYSNQDPGISIDPIAPGVDKHLVRYIGKVVNTDLGKVMRDADYQMKKWAVGTERADIRGFKNPDEYAAERRKLYLAASRFWFVPKNMKFKRSDDALLFDDGRMTIQTEYLTASAEKGSSPSNEKFAAFFTDHYNEIAEKYPVYDELFEYAKMVSLAKYLKEEGIPLFWFLMANKDLVITEDSPGTVDELAKSSDYFRGIEISGGVNLDFDAQNQAHYVYDKEAIEAINKAVSENELKIESDTALSSDKKITNLGPDPFSFNLGRESYTVVPQHSLTSGKDRRGVRYQTDIAVRGQGLQLTQHSLDVLKSDLVYRKTMEEMEPVLKTMKKHDLDQDEIYALYEVKKKKAEKRITQILNRLTKIKNKKYSDKDKFVSALSECLGTELTEKWKPSISKVSYYDTKLELVRYFNPKLQNAHSGNFGNGWNILVPFRIKPAGKSKRKFLNVMIPSKMSLVNLITGEEEVLGFSTDRYTSAGYVPDQLEDSQVVGLFLLSDASYRLADKLGNEFRFNQNGYLTDMIFSKDHHIRYKYLEGFTDAFEKNIYSTKPEGNDRIPFLNVTLPKRMKVMDHVHNKSEIFIFSDKGQIQGYVPEDRENSRFKIMVLMSNASFRLIDKNGNEVSLTSTGRFDKMAAADDSPIISSISQGNQKITFKYTLNNSGDILIASANLLENEENDIPGFVVKYEYDKEGRLAGIKKINNRMISRQETQSSVKMASN